MEVLGVKQKGEQLKDILQFSELVKAFQGVFDTPVHCALKWQDHKFKCHKFMESCCLSENWKMYVNESRKINLIRTCVYPYDTRQQLVLLFNAFEDERFERNQIAPPLSSICFVPAGDCLIELCFSKSFIRLRDAALLEELSRLI